MSIRLSLHRAPKFSGVRTNVVKIALFSTEVIKEEKSVVSNARVLLVYKNLLRYAKRFPEPKRGESLQQIKREFRSNVSESNAKAVEEMIKKANSSLGYLKIVTPRRNENQTGSITLVFNNKEAGTSESGSESPSVMSRKAHTNWTGSNMDPDSVARHYASLKRAGFSNNSHAKGGMF